MDVRDFDELRREWQDLRDEQAILIAESRRIRKQSMRLRSIAVCNREAIKAHIADKSKTLDWTEVWLDKRQ
jgi:hypothetical protein